MDYAAIMSLPRTRLCPVRLCQIAPEGLVRYSAVFALPVSALPIQFSALWFSVFWIFHSMLELCLDLLCVTVLTLRLTFWPVYPLFESWRKWINTFAKCIWSAPGSLSATLTMELDSAMPQLYKMFSLVATIGATSAGVERSFSCLKWLKSYTRNTMGQGRLTSLSLLATERTMMVTGKDS